MLCDCMFAKYFKRFLYMGLTEYCLAVHLAEGAECYATVCLQNKV